MCLLHMEMLCALSNACCVDVQKRATAGEIAAQRLGLLRSFWPAQALPWCLFLDICLWSSLSCSSPQGCFRRPTLKLCTCLYRTGSSASQSAGAGSFASLESHSTFRCTVQLLLAACSTFSCAPLQDWQRRQPAHRHTQLSWPQSQPHTVQRLLPAHPPGQVHAFHGRRGVCPVIRPGPHCARLQPGAELRWAPKLPAESRAGYLLWLAQGMCCLTWIPPWKACSRSRLQVSWCLC